MKYFTIYYMKLKVFANWEHPEVIHHREHMSPWALAVCALRIWSDHTHDPSITLIPS